MNVTTQQITQRRHLDRTFVEVVRCALGLHPMGAWELKDFTLTVQEGRKQVKYTVWFNVREAICCGKSEMERVA